MIINNKNFKEWSSDDISIIIDNDAYRESEFIDYKENFTILECHDRVQKRIKQNEFRHDICSFANANGGYLIFGIREDKGIPIEIIGISIENKDKFELNRRNELCGIMPVVPRIDFAFIYLSDTKYVVIIKILKGINKSYVFIENEGIFKFFIRRGNGKQTMSYMEINNNFLHPNFLSNEIKKFRNEKMLFYKEEQKGIPFTLLQIIPEDFINNYYNETLLYDAFQGNKLNFRNIFGNELCYNRKVPNVDGIYFSNYHNRTFLQIYNNGIIELFYKINTVDTVESQTKKICYTEIIENIELLIQGTTKLYRELEQHKAMYVCIGIFGCKGLISEDNFWREYTGIVDRNEIFCMPLKINDILDNDNINKIVEETKKLIYYSLSIKYHNK